MRVGSLKAMNLFLGGDFINVPVLMMIDARSSMDKSLWGREGAAGGPDSRRVDRIVLWHDGDNVPVLNRAEAQSLYDLVLERALKSVGAGSAAGHALVSWQLVVPSERVGPGYRELIRRGVTVVDSGQKANAVDLMIKDMVGAWMREQAYLVSGGIDALRERMRATLAVVVSSDSDFLNEIRELRRIGTRVVAVGRATSASSALRRCVDGFVDLDLVGLGSDRSKPTRSPTRGSGMAAEPAGGGGVAKPKATKPAGGGGVAKPKATKPAGGGGAAKQPKATTKPAGGGGVAKQPKATTKPAGGGGATKIVKAASPAKEARCPASPARSVATRVLQILRAEGGEVLASALPDLYSKRYDRKLRDDLREAYGTKKQKDGLREIDGLRGPMGAGGHWYYLVTPSQASAGPSPCSSVREERRRETPSPTLEHRGGPPPALHSTPPPRSGVDRVAATIATPESDGGLLGELLGLYDTFTRAPRTSSPGDRTPITFEDDPSPPPSWRF